MHSNELHLFLFNSQNAWITVSLNWKAHATPEHLLTKDMTPSSTSTWKPHPDSWPVLVVTRMLIMHWKPFYFWRLFLALHNNIWVFFKQKLIVISVNVITESFCHLWFHVIGLDHNGPLYNCNRHERSKCLMVQWKKELYELKTVFSHCQMAYLFCG